MARYSRRSIASMVHLEDMVGVKDTSLSGPKFMSKVMSKLSGERNAVKRKVVTDMWKRNNLNSPKQRENYSIDERVTVTSDGAEVTTYRLWKLVDESQLVVTPEIRYDQRIGIQKGVDDELRREPQTDPTQSPI